MDELLSRARALALGVLLLCAARGAWAQDPGVVADVPYLASPQGVVDEMLRLAGVEPGDVVYDLGSGDGRVAITAAAKFGARAVGVEIDPAMVKLSRSRIAQAGVGDRVSILQQDLFKTDLSPATVVTLYLAPHLNLRLRERLLGLRPGTRIVSHSADLGDWKPDARTAIRKDVLLWIAPAKVAGRWRARVPGAFGEGTLELEFKQAYQAVSAQAKLDGAPLIVWEPRIKGAMLEFVLVDPRADTNLYFTARVDGERIAGEVARDVGRMQTRSAWSAAKLSH